MHIASIWKISPPLAVIFVIGLVVNFKIMTQLEKLKEQKQTLFLKALKQFPNSPIQLKTRAEIDKITKKIKVLESKKKK